jgi:hypothetical protein
MAASLAGRHRFEFQSHPEVTVPWQRSLQRCKAHIQNDDERRLERVTRTRSKRRARVYFKPSFFPAASKEIDSRMRLARVSGRLAM